MKKVKATITDVMTIMIHGDNTEVKGMTFEGILFESPSPYFVTNFGDSNNCPWIVYEHQFDKYSVEEIKEEEPPKRALTLLESLAPEQELSEVSIKFK